MFDPRGFLAFAERFSIGEPDEATCRSAISRAYYAAYLVAYQYISANKLRVIPAKGQRLGPHERTIHAVGEIRHPGAQYIADELTKLKRRRIDSDYRPGYTQARRHMPGAVRDAAMIISWIDGLSSPAETNRYSAAWFELFLADVDSAQTAREVAFLVRNLPAPPAAVLDVCCGSGRHAAPLADAGYDVLGIDRDASVIERAGAAHPAERLTFRMLDMTRLDELDGSFDAVICMWQSFGYGDADTNAEVLRQMTARLHSGGRLVLDIYNRDFFESRQGERETTQRGEAIRTRQRLEDDRLIVALDYLDRGERERFDWQVFTSESIAALADRCGLRVLVACTDFDERVPPSIDQPRMQLVLERF